MFVIGNFIVVSQQLTIGRLLSTLLPLKVVRHFAFQRVHALLGSSYHDLFSSLHTTYLAVCKMATVRRLVISEYTIPRIQTTGRLRCCIYIPNRHYWGTKSGAPYARTLIYNREAYCSRWIQQRDVRNARLCGSWPRRKSRDHIPGKETSQKSEPETEKGSRSHNRQKDNESIDIFYKQLKHDAANTYNYYKDMIERDPYRWLFDPNNNKYAWNPVEWLEKHQETFDKRRSQLQNLVFEKPLHESSKTSPSNTPAEHKMVAEEYVIDPITLRKIPVQKKSEQSHTKVSIAHDIPVKRYNSIRDKPLNNPIHNAKTSQTQLEGSNSTEKSSSSGTKGGPKLLGFANQPWLAKEGFAAAQKSSRTDTIGTNNPNVVRPERIEPSLNRISKSKVDWRSSLKYPLPEKTTDDVDLLCASDVRAASGHTRIKDRPSPATTEARSKALKSSWQDTAETYSQNLNKVYDEVLEKRKSRIKPQTPDHIPGESQEHSDIEFKKAKQHYDELQHELDQTRKVLEQARTRFLQDRLASETNTIKESFDSFETRPRKQILIANNVNNSARPLHEDKPGIENADKSSGIERSKRDANLVAQIKNIYEQRYGEITIGHRQSGLEDKSRREGRSSAPELLPNERSKSVGSISSKTTPAQSSNACDNQTRAFEHTTGVPLRDLLYQSISDMSIPKKTQRRLMFALRGIPELDEVIHKSDQVNTVSPTESTAIYTEITNPMDAEKIRNSFIKNPISKDESTGQGNEKDVHDAHSKRSEERTWIYKILALDIASNEVAVATTTSSIRHKASIPRSAAGILVYLDQAPKYFSHMERLDADGFQLVSGSSTMLVYRKRTGQDSISTVPTVKSNISSSNSGGLKPLREEAVFSGPLNPKERLLRSYQLAHRRARSDSKNNTSTDNVNSSAEGQSDGPRLNEKRSLRSKLHRAFTSKIATVILAVLVCYAVGVLQRTKAQKEAEEDARKRKEEAAMRRIEAQRNDWKWF